MEEAMTGATLAMFIGLFGKLKARGVLTGDDLADIFDQATLGLERIGVHGNPGVMGAHTILSQLQTIVLGTPATPDE